MQSHMQIQVGLWDRPTVPKVLRPKTILGSNLIFPKLFLPYFAQYIICLVFTIFIFQIKKFPVLLCSAYIIS